MPIKRENYHLYPGGSPHSKEWKAIVARIKARAGNVCERCRVPNRVLIRRDKAARIYVLPDGEIRSADTGETLGTLTDATPWFDRLEDPVEVILTVAHVEHDPRRNDDTDLRAWCQMCHNGHDGAHRRANAARTRAARSLARNRRSGTL
jgi:hypothetical protein